MKHSWRPTGFRPLSGDDRGQRRPQKRHRDAANDELPSGVDIARWFVEQEHFANNGGDYFSLSTEGRCSFWLLAFVDHDDQEFHLLDVATNGSHDLLFVSSGIQGLACEWRNRPADQQEWGYDGLTWFAGMIEEYERGWGIERPSIDEGPTTRQLRGDIAAVLTVYDEHVAMENRGPWRDRLAALVGYEQTSHKERSTDG